MAEKFLQATIFTGDLGKKLRAERDVESRNEAVQEGLGKSRGWKSCGRARILALPLGSDTYLGPAIWPFGTSVSSSMKQGQSDNFSDCQGFDVTSEKHPRCVRCLEIARGSLRSAGFLCKRVKEMGHVGLQVCGKAFSFGEEAILTFQGWWPSWRYRDLAATPDGVGPCPVVIASGTFFLTHSPCSLSLLFWCCVLGLIRFQVHLLMTEVKLF